MGTKFTFKDESVGEMTVDVTSFSYSMNCNTGRAMLNIHGTVGKSGVSCKFAFESSRTGHTLTFRDAWAVNGTDQFAVAREVKNTLLEFVRQHSDIPESFREKFMNCILRHHLKGQRNAPAPIAP